MDVLEYQEALAEITSKLSIAMGLNPESYDCNGTDISCAIDAARDATHIIVQYMMGRYVPSVKWNPSCAMPDVAAGGQREFWVVTQSMDEPPKVDILWWVNKPIQYDADGELMDGCVSDHDGNPVKAFGWHRRNPRDGYLDWYDVVNFSEKYKLLNWAELLRPGFDGLPINGLQLIADERASQVLIHGRTLEGDLKSASDHSLAMAGASYALCAAVDPDSRQASMCEPPKLWPWDKEHWKPSDGDSIDGRISDLKKAGALIAAEIDRLLHISQGLADDFKP